MKILKPSFYLILAMLMALGMLSCSDRTPVTTSTPMVAFTPTAALPTPTPQDLPVSLSGNQKGSFLVNQGQVIPLAVQHLSASESIYARDLPRTDDPQPAVLFRQENVNAGNLVLRRMVGGIGIVFASDVPAGGMMVQDVRPGFGAESGGLRPGDLILVIDGKPLKDFISDKDFDDKIDSLIPGELGSQLKLTVRRSGQDIELNITRNLPTVVPSARGVSYRLTQGKDNVTQLTPDQALAPGLYCYQSGQDDKSLGDFYCFLQSKFDTAWQVLPTPVASATRTPATPIPGSSAFKITDCRFPVRPGQAAQCGDLTVPEDRRQPGGKTIRLHVAIFRAASSPQPDPVIYLHGGPGGALEWIAEAYATGYQYLFPNRDLIAFDQRGAGYSQPRLDCPSLADDYAKSLTEDQRVSSLAWTSARMDACRAELMKQNINLAAYTTQASAADLHDLIEALGYKQVNLFGESYGAYLALTYMKEYGAEGHIRSAVLSGVYPPQADLFAERGPNAQRAFDAIFAACLANSACNTAYPDLAARFYKLLERLDANPVTVQAINPLNGQQQPVVVNSSRLLEIVYRSSYQAGWIPKLPKTLADMERGDYALAASALANVFQSASSVDEGIYFAILCSDEASFTRLDAAQAGNAKMPPPMKAYFNGTAEAMLQVCSNWPTAPASSSQNQAVVGDIPTLLLSGSFDPITPPAWARLAAGTLSKGHAYEFPAEAHDVLTTSSCAQAVTVEFVQNPAEPRHHCLGELPGPIFQVP